MPGDWSVGSWFIVPPCFRLERRECTADREDTLPVRSGNPTELLRVEVCLILIDVPSTSSTRMRTPAFGHLDAEWRSPRTSTLRRSSNTGCASWPRM